MVRDLSRAYRRRRRTQGYSVDGLQFTLSSDSRQFTYITGFRGVVEQGKLVRVWCVARDITELVELNQRLRQKQDRLQLYARQLVGAEERARRATAVDLHDGIGQHLVGLAMTLDAAASRSPPEVRLLLGEATHTVREVQSITQKVIADLSPPGLYELGLEPALKWLSVYMRGKDNLQVDLQVAPDAAAYNLELRVLVFKLIRELLRNVVKHAGVQSAAVTVTQTPEGTMRGGRGSRRGVRVAAQPVRGALRGIRPVERGGPGACRRRRDDGRYRAGPRVPRLGGVSPSRNPSADPAARFGRQPLRGHLIRPPQSAAQD